jgi:hypothetical protein
MPFSNQIFCSTLVMLIRLILCIPPTPSPHPTRCR